MPLTASRLTDLRARAADYLLDTCQIDAPTNTADAMGGYSTTWSARGTAIPCYLEAKQTAELAPSGDRLATFTEFTLHVGSSQAIVAGDRVILSSSTYKVEGILAGQTRRAYKSAKLTLET